MKILFVAGTFNNDGGKASKLVEKFAQEIAKCGYDITIHNGGYFKEISEYLQETKNYDVVFWWANVPNNYEKIRDVKEVNPKCMLITSKRNDNAKYNFAQLINFALTRKANLCVEFSKQNGIFEIMVFDPLGTMWYKGTDISQSAKKIMERLEFLSKIKRQGTIKVNKNVEVPDEPEFFALIKDYAEVFHRLINPANEVTRFLGNSSYRCQRGFPSFKSGQYIFVSRRNVDKRYIDKDNFVPVYYKDGKVYYVGENKPSVDTPVQVRLYNELQNINYMIHAHVYIKGAPFTETPIPCGGLEEVEEVLKTIDEYYNSRNESYYAINLIGHGCIVMADSTKLLGNLKYVAREMPEIV